MIVMLSCICCLLCEEAVIPWAFLVCLNNNVVSYIEEAASNIVMHSKFVVALDNYASCLPILCLALLRFQVAKMLEMPVSSKAMDAVLGQLNSDMNWDTTCPVQNGFFLAGELRYDMKQVRLTWAKTMSKEGNAEKISGSKEAKSKLSLEEGAAQARSAGVEIKVENPLLADFKTKITTLKQGRSNLIALVLFIVCLCNGDN
jgi:hypothetical protein